MKIFEAVPNIAEGRDQKKINLLLAEIKGVADLRLLDHSLDMDHNRSVFTYIGTAEAIKSASLRLVKKAAEIIDLSQHEGIHPRNGVVDVLPIIPVIDCDMAEAVTLSRAIGEEIKERLQLPVCYYENSADNEKYRNLANIRADSYNFAKHPTAGFITVGARDYLVAYNVNLESKDLETAGEIAEELREKKSNLAGLKALGFYLKSRDIVQISMNLTKPQVVGPEIAFKAVKEKAEEYNMKVLEDELVGILPDDVIKEAQKLSDEIDVLLAKAKDKDKKNDNADT